MNETNLNETAVSTEAETPVTYTAEQVEQECKAAYQEGQKVGYVAAIRQIRNDINEYLNDLIVSAQCK